MSEFNLVPEEFLSRERKRSVLMVAGMALAGLMLAFVAAYGTVTTVLAGSEDEVEMLRHQKALSMQQQERLAQLQKRKEQLLNDKLLLSSLRSGVTMPELVRAIEGAIPDEDVRFDSWQFRRAGIRTESEPEPRPPSYFFMMQEEQGFPKIWESMTHMTIRGVAKDHKALSHFVQRLFGQPNIDDVRIQRSSRGEEGVTFLLAIVVRSAEDHS